MRACLAALVFTGCVVDSRPPPQTPPAPAPVEEREHRTDPAPVAQDGPIDCHGDEAITLSSCIVEGDVAVSAHGSCAIVLTNCTIRGRIAISAHGNASIVVDGGSVEGSDLAVDAHGSAAVAIRGATVAGEIEQRGNARVDVR